MVFSFKPALISRLRSFDFSGDILAMRMIFLYHQSGHIPLHRRKGKSNGKNPTCKKHSLFHKKDPHNKKVQHKLNSCCVLNAESLRCQNKRLNSMVVFAPSGRASCNGHALKYILRQNGIGLLKVNSHAIQYEQTLPASPFLISFVKRGIAHANEGVIILIESSNLRRCYFTLKM